MAYNNSQLFVRAAILLLLVSLASAYFGTGPYEVKNIHVLPCEDQGTNEMNISIQMYRTQDRTKRVIAHRGAITWPARGISYRIFLSSYKMGTDWILVTNYDEEFCKAVSHVPSFWAEWCKRGNHNGTTCPPPAGRYEINEWVLAVQPVTPVLPYGKYKVIVNFRNEKNEVAGCVCVFNDIVQKF